MENFLNKLVEIATNAGSKLLLALLVYIIGKFVIKKVVALLKKGKAISKMDPTVSKFILDGINIVLYVILVVSIIGILGVPMASVVTVLASAGVAVGMALQGSLSNLAGGIMLLIFRPFSVGDYINGGGAEGTVKEIDMFYTVLTTIDNRRITIPNGTLMNANVTNFSAEPLRRVDLTFNVAKDTDIVKAEAVMLDAIGRTEKTILTPEPFARLSGGTNETLEFTVRVWTKSEDYWDVYFDLTKGITKALGEAGIKAPAARVITEQA